MPVLWAFGTGPEAGAGDVSRVRLGQGLGQTLGLLGSRTWEGACARPELRDLGTRPAYF